MGCLQSKESGREFFDPDALLDSIEVTNELQRTELKNEINDLRDARAGDTVRVSACFRSCA